MQKVAKQINCQCDRLSCLHVANFRPRHTKVSQMFGDVRGGNFAWTDPKFAFCVSRIRVFSPPSKNKKRRTIECFITLSLRKQPVVATADDRINAQYGPNIGPS